METLFTVLHVVTAVFIVGPMAVLPMTALRGVRAGNSGQVAVLAKSTMVITLLSLIVFVLGFGVMGMSDERFDLSVTTPWILLSIIAYVIAALLNFLFVIPNMRKAAASATGDAVAGSSGKPAGYAAISAGSGVVSLLLVVVVVLMVWKP